MISGLMQIIQTSTPWAGAQKRDTHCSLLSVSAAPVSAPPHRAPACQTPLSLPPAHGTEMGGQVLAENGRGEGATPWVCQLEKPSLLGAGRDPRALALPELAALTAFLLFLSSGCRAKGTSLLCPWGLPKPGLQEHPSLQELQVQLSPQVSSLAWPGGAQLLPCWAGSALPGLLLTCYSHQHPALLCTPPTSGSAPCSPRPGPGAAPGPQLE